jgi:wyosine [tRNA(Phe)-imidazoG37] synthetase (radical SAM superfamily)
MSTQLPHTRHERLFEANRYVYPVISRRAGGLSIGVNLNPDKACNFDCIYCQVDRTVESETRFVGLDQLLEELDRMVPWAASGRIYDHPLFRDVPSEWRRWNDIAFSGDGEPTTYRNFDDILAACAEVKRRHGAQGVKLVLITNASMLHRPHVQRGLKILDANQGEIWAKLDAGTEDYFRRVDRTRIPFSRILENITAAAQARPLVIQALFMRIQDEPPVATELDAFCQRLNEITAAGGKLRLIQVYTVARQPAESFVAPLRSEEVDAIAERVRQQTGLAATAFYGPSP